MGRHKSYDRDEVLNRAIRVFHERGYEGAHLSLLVEETGLNRFSLYKEFGSKEGLFEAALSAYIERMEDLKSILLREPQGAQNIRDFFDALISDDFFHGCFIMNTIREKHVVASGAWQMIVDFVSGGEALVKKNLKAAKAAGEISADTDINALGSLLVSIDIGILTYGVLQPSKRVRRKALSLIDRLLV